MARTAQTDLAKVAAKIRKIVEKAASADELRALGEEACNIIRIRTRLGYGARPTIGGERFRHRPLSERYIRFREGARDLSNLTTPSRSNLTLTGQMLESLDVIRVARGTLVIGPTGTRTDRRSRGVKNEQVARWLADQGRTFMGLTTPEVSQLVRFYRTRFGDLVRKGR
jgi:hypothetical protein